MKIHDCKQGEIEWLKKHIGLPTSSGLDNMLDTKFEERKGEMVKTYLFKKIAEKWRGKPLVDLQASSFSMEQGLILESEALPWYELETGQTVTRVGFITTDDGRCGCSPDGLLPDDCGIEIKSPAAHTHVKYLVGGVLPREYAVQVQASMYVTGFDKWVFVSYRRGFPALVLEINRDPKAQEAIHKAVDHFHALLEQGLEKIGQI